MVYTVIKLTFRRITVHSTIQFKLVRVVAFEFHQACKANAFGNVTIKVTRHSADGDGATMSATC